MRDEARACIAALRFHGLTRFYDRVMAAVFGFSTTADNVAALLPVFMEEAGFARVAEAHRESTFFGTLSYYRGERETA